MYMNGYIITLSQEIRFGGILQEDNRAGGPKGAGHRVLKRILLGHFKPPPNATQWIVFEVILSGFGRFEEPYPPLSNMYDTNISRPYTVNWNQKSALWQLKCNCTSFKLIMAHFLFNKFLWKSVELFKSIFESISILKRQ